MPLAESPDDQAAISLTQIKSGQHMPAPTLEPGLKISRAAGNLAGIAERLPVPKRRLLEPWLRR
ncbi:MAG TPA: hypothetical protein VGO33_02765 [Gemmatimonadaceae bacterium]|nr:hypothetical protein [Gemmatimonadaceae bacterium]